MSQSQFVPVPRDQIDPRLEAAQKQLGFLIMQRRGNEPLNERLVKDLEKMVRDYRDHCKNRGMDFPRCVVVVFAKMDHISIWPAELDHAEIQKRLRMLVLAYQRRSRQIDPEDMAQAVRRAYPDYSPSTSSLINPAVLKFNNPTETSP